MSLSFYQTTPCPLYCVPDANTEANSRRQRTESVIGEVACVLLVVLLLATTAQRLGSAAAAADVTVITRYLHISDLLCDWTVDNLPLLRPFLVKLRAVRKVLILLLR